jgi:hypothetical protein
VSREQALAGRLVLAAALLAAALVWPLAADALRAPAAPAAHRTRALNVTDTAYLHLTHTDGYIINEEGPAYGTLPGTLKAHFSIVGTTVSASFTINVRGGSIRGHGAGRLNSSGLKASFGGTMQALGGAGRYVHASGHGGFYGTINRESLSSIVQTAASKLYY